MMLHLWRNRFTRSWAAVCACLAVALAGVLLVTTAPSRTVAARSGSAALVAALRAAGLRPGTQFTPVIASTLTVPAPFEGSDNRIHLAYELLLLNTSPFPVRISQVQVLDAATHRVLLNLTGAALKAQFTPVGAPEGDEGGHDPGNPS